MTLALVGNAIILAANDVADRDDIDCAWSVGMNLDIGPFSILDAISVDAFLQLLDSHASSFAPEEILLVKQYLMHLEANTVVSA